MKRKKGIEHRISYYVRKCAEYGRHRPHRGNLPAWYGSRHGRLLRYKAALHKRIEAERGCAANV